MRYRIPVSVTVLVVLVVLVGLLSAPASSMASTDTAAERDQVSTQQNSGVNADAQQSDPIPQVEASATCDYEQLYNQTISSVVLIQAGDGLGSGFVYQQDNGTTYVVTNEHVVGDTAQADVKFSGGESRSGTVVGATALTDLAVVRVTDAPDSASPIPIAEGTPNPGEYVAAIGSPFGLERTITSGIVSGVDRQVPVQEGHTIPGSVQTDAAINPGNSGGPLVSCENGTVVGVNRAGGAEDIGFAVSAPIVQRVVPALIQNGTVEYPFLGVGVADVTSGIAQANDLNTTEGVMVVETLRGTNASQTLQEADQRTTVAGQRVPVGGDVIVAVDGEPVDDRGDLVSYLLTETRPGETVELTVVRDGQRENVTVTLSEQPEPDPGPA